MTRTKGDAGLALLLGVGTAAFLLAVRALEQTGDSLAYAYMIKNGWNMFHPHHLLFAPIVRALYLPLSAWNAGFDAVLAAQLHDVFWASTAVACVFLLVLRSVGSRAIAAATALALLSCRGFEYYATQVEVYVPAAGCAALLLLVALRDAEGRAVRTGPWLVAAVLSLLVFYHQTNVLFCIPLVLLLGLAAGRAGLWRGAIAVCAAGVLVLATYIAVYVLQPGPASPTGFIDYTLRYAVGAYSPDWGNVENLGGGGVLEAIDSQLWCMSDLAEGPLGRAVAQVAIAALLLWSAACFARRPRREALRGALLLWLFVHWMFYVWWQPGQKEFFLIMLVPLVLLLGLALHDLARALTVPRAAPVLAGVCIAICVGIVIPRHLIRTLLPAHRTRGMTYAVAQIYADLAPDCIHLNGRIPTLGLRYYRDFGPAESMNIKHCRRRIVRPEGREALPDLPADRCVVTLLEEVLPPTEADLGHGRPAGWFNYYRWLFRVEPSAGGVRVQPVTLSEPPGLPPLVIQRGASLEFDGMSGFFEALSRERRLAPLAAWLHAHYAALSKSVDPALLGPDRD